MKAFIHSIFLVNIKAQILLLLYNLVEICSSVYSKREEKVKQTTVDCVPLLPTVAQPNLT